MYKELEKITKSIKGNVLTIGIDNTLLSYFDSNNNINLDVINNANSTKKKKFSITSKKNKYISIKKIRKYINKKSVDYLFCNVDEIIKFYKYIIKDTIYINQNMIYIYSNDISTKDFIINKYKRYDVKIKVLEYKSGYLLKIDNTNGKNKYIKDLLYLIKDTSYNISETIGNFMIS